MDNTLKTSQGKIRKIIDTSSKTRISKDVFPVLNEKLLEIIDKHVNNLNINGKKTVTEQEVSGVISQDKEICLPKAPFRARVREVLFKQHNISRITDEALLKLQLLVEADLKKISDYAIMCMNNGPRKTLFPQDVKLAIDMHNENTKNL